MSERDAILHALTELAGPLVRGDGGELFVVRIESGEVDLYLTGTCAGCPGAAITRERLLEPAVRGVAPGAVVRVSTGWKVPEGALKLT